MHVHLHVCMCIGTPVFVYMYVLKKGITRIKAQQWASASEGCKCGGLPYHQTVLDHMPFEAGVCVSCILGLCLDALQSLMQSWMVGFSEVADLVCG